MFKLWTPDQQKSINELKSLLKQFEPEGHVFKFDDDRMVTVLFYTNMLIKIIAHNQAKDSDGKVEIAIVAIDNGEAIFDYFASTAESIEELPWKGGTEFVSYGNKTHTDVADKVGRALNFV